MTRLALLLLCFIVVGSAGAQDVALTTRPAPEEPSVAPALAYTRPRIEELVKSGRAMPHGAVFENQGLGCHTYLWNDRDDHTVFFFARDGAFLGEFRDERLEDHRFVEVTEHYLGAEARARKKLADERELPFVFKRMTFHWKEGVCVGSTVQWQLVTLDQNGTVIRAGPPKVETMVRRVVTLTVPKEFRNLDVEYYVKAYRPETTEFERAFDGVHVTREKTFAFNPARLDHGQCTIRLEWPESRPELVFELHERVPNPPRDASPNMVRTKKVSSMTVTALPANGEPLMYKP